jgi:hypothetical protein
MWGRLPYTRADIQMLHGILRQLLRNPPTRLDDSGSEE